MKSLINAFEQDKKLDDIVSSFLIDDAFCNNECINDSRFMLESCDSFVENSDKIILEFFSDFCKYRFYYKNDKLIFSGIYCDFMPSLRDALIKSKEKNLEATCYDLSGSNNDVLILFNNGKSILAKHNGLEYTVNFILSEKRNMEQSEINGTKNIVDKHCISSEPEINAMLEKLESYFKN